MRRGDVGRSRYHAPMPGRGGREGSDSRCCQPQTAPLQWHDHVDHAHTSVVGLREWLQALAPFARAHEQGEIDDLLDAAARGELQDTGDEKTPIKPIVTKPDVFELRRTALAKKLRLYHGEPPSDASALVALHRHIKVDSKSQKDEIKYAVARYKDWTGEEPITNPVAQP